MLGFNERRYPYLDEGFNTFSEFRYMRTKYPDLKLYRFLFDHAACGQMDEHRKTGLTVPIIITDFCFLPAQSRISR